MERTRAQLPDAEEAKPELIGKLLKDSIIIFYSFFILKNSLIIEIFLDKSISFLIF